MANKAIVKDLIAQKEKIEGEIKELHEVLVSQGNVGMKEQLVDSEGYPRNDVDVYQVRITRNRISCLQNDHKTLMKEIEDQLHELHSQNKQTSSDVPMFDISIVDPIEPFATINLVSSGSPAELCGLVIGDEVVQFGSVNKSNFQNLQTIATVVHHSEGKTVEIKVKRGGCITRLLLTPKKWNGRGLLGCNIVPLPR